MWPITLSIFCAYVPALAFVPFIFLRVPTPQSLPDGGDTAAASNPKTPLTEASELVIKALLVLLLPLWINLCWNVGIKVAILKVLMKQ